MSHTKLREFVRRVIAEEGDYGGIGDGGYGSYGYDSAGMYGGMGGWGGKSVLSVFGSPFLDVAKTAVGSGKEVFAQAKGLARTTIEATLSAVLPFVSGEYEKISKETHEEVQKIKKDYQEVYKRNLDAIFNTDLVTLAFFLNPAAVVTGAAFDRFMYSAPDAALSVLGWFVPISGRKMWERLMKSVDPHRLQKILKTAAGAGSSKTRLIVWDDRNRRRLYANVRQAMGIEPGPGGDDDFHESISRPSFVISEGEDQASSRELTYPQVVKGVLRDPTVVMAMTKSEQAQALKSRGQEIVKKRLSQIYALAKKACSQISGPDPKAVEEAQKQVIERLAKSLAAELEALKSAGVDPDRAGLTGAYSKITEELHGLLNKSPTRDSVSKQGDTDKHGEKAERRTGTSDGGEAAGRAGSSQGAG